MAFERLPARHLPPAGRTTRWRDVDTANRITTDVLRAHEPRLRESAARSVPFVELRSAVSPEVGTAWVRERGAVVEVPVRSAVVRLDLSGSSPVVLTSAPDVVDPWDDSWDLLQVLTRCGPDGAEHWDDPLVAVDAALVSDPGLPARALQQWRGHLGGDRSEEGIAQFFHSLVGPPTPLPVEGQSWVGWAEWFEAHLGDVAQGRGVVGESRVGSSGVGASPCLRTGEFSPGEDVSNVVAEVLDRTSSVVARWVAEPGGTRRTVVRADLGRMVGAVVTRRPDLAVGTSWVALVLQRGRRGGWEVLDAHPDRVPPEVDGPGRTVAAQLLPAYFGPGTSRLEVLPWPAQRALLSGEPAPVVARFAQEVEEILAAGEAAVRTTLTDLGAAVVPSDASGWLSRMVWRSRRFAWAG